MSNSSKVTLLNVEFSEFRETTGSPQQKATFYLALSLMIMQEFYLG